MKREDKKLLVKALTAYMPYGLQVEFNGTGLSGQLHSISIYPKYEGDDIVDYDAMADFFGDGEWQDISNIKPYLRSMNDMTEDEQNEYDYLLNDGGWGMSASGCTSVVEFLNSHFFDYNDLIPRKLANETKHGEFPYC